MHRLLAAVTCGFDGRDGGGFGGHSRCARSLRREAVIGKISNLARLQSIEWDFAAAQTASLTHNLHPYPAKFIPQIPHALIQELSSVGETVADIFCGSGTTLLV
ncbi:DNA methyltransferase [Candidatus Palauibacter sp.]|uniref:DNA methyltransferase n=1 Tax=Candidatus Palauibacter sp. TaxID=3101350 RepID=UPI003B595D19